MAHSLHPARRGSVWSIILKWFTAPAKRTILFTQDTLFHERWHWKKSSKHESEDSLKITVIWMIFWITDVSAVVSSHLLLPLLGGTCWGHPAPILIKAIWIRSWHKGLRTGVHLPSQMYFQITKADKCLPALCYTLIPNPWVITGAIRLAKRIKEIIHTAHVTAGDLTAAFQYLKECYRKEGDRLLSWVCGDRTKGNDFKLKEGIFRLGLLQLLKISK